MTSDGQLSQANLLWHRILLSSVSSCIVKKTVRMLSSLLPLTSSPPFCDSCVRVDSFVFASRKCVVLKMSALTKKRKNEKTLTLEDKAAGLDAVAAGEKKKSVAARFGIPASSLSTILNAKDAIRSAVEAGTGGKKLTPST